MKTVTTPGTSLSTVLLVVFIILKLTHVIDWSWWWVMAPLWIPIAILALVFSIGVLVVFIIDRLDSRKRKARR